MVAIFEPDENRGQTRQRTRTARPEDVASLAQRRQEQRVQRKIVGPGETLFPVAGAPGTIPNILGGDDRAESGGVLKPPNPGTYDGSDAEVEPVVSIADLPTRSERLESEPKDKSYAELVPAQREQAIRRLGVEPVSAASDEEGRPRRSGSGAAILGINTGIEEAAPVFLAEDGVAAHSLLFRMVRDYGIRARPVESVDGYTLAFEVDDGYEIPFVRSAVFLEPTKVEGRDGKVYVSFDQNNVVNRQFTDAPFGGRDGRS